ncbi:MAG: hypothetical protein WC096_01915 [Sphaerochaetaceae bacterium]|jgi:hypothetical protein
MKKKALLWMIACITVFAGCSTTNRGYGVFTGVVSHIVERTNGYGLVVVDANELTAEQVSQMKTQSSFVYGYLDIASFHGQTETYPGMPFGYDPDRDVMWMQVDDEAWRSYCFDQADGIVAKGIEGLFVDGCDEYAIRRYEGIYRGLLDIIDRLKTYGLPIIINNGEVFLTRALKERGPQYVTGVNREGVFTDKYYGMRSESDIAFFKTYLSSCKRMGLDVYIIEYGIPQKQILSFAEQNGYHLYFAPDKSKS